MVEYQPAAHYENPPIEEAIVQLKLATPIAWTVATPGLAYAAIRDTYPVNPEAQQQLSATVNSEGGQGTGFKLEQGGTRILFKDEAFQKFAILSEGIIAAGCRAPYTDWPEMRARLVDLVSKTGVIYGPDLVFSSVSIRYINRVVIRGVTRVDTDDYFTIPVPTARSGALGFRSFLSQVESIVDETTVARLAFATLESNGDGMHFLLDLDYIAERLALNLEAALEKADGLKNEENMEFESRITDRTRGLFANGDF